jgi:hypothetical protein
MLLTSANCQEGIMNDVLVQRRPRPVPGVSELDELHSLSGGVRRCVTSLQSRYGDTPTVRRVVNDAGRLLNDIELLDIDVAELDFERPAPQPDVGEKIPVPDTDYDISFWRGIDDEGIGGRCRST